MCGKKLVSDVYKELSHKVGRTPGAISYKMGKLGYRILNPRDEEMLKVIRQGGWIRNITLLRRSLGSALKPVLRSVGGVGDGDIV